MIANGPGKHFLGKVKNLLDEGVKNLNSQTGQQLEHIRISALRPMEEKRSRFLTPAASPRPR